MRVCLMTSLDYACTNYYWIKLSVNNPVNSIVGIQQLIEHEIEVPVRRSQWKETLQY